MDGACSYKRALVIAGLIHAIMIVNKQVYVAPDSTIAAPKEIRLTFSEKLTPAFSGFGLSMGDGMTMKVATKLSKDGATLIGTPTGSFMTGAYKISWHATASDDGHRTEGSLMFKVK
jgi:methionine-rich copper-binding protein CopC